MSTCRSCKAPIWWGITAQGKLMPLNPEPTPDGNVVKTDNFAKSRQGTEMPVVEVRAAEMQLFDAKEHREPRYLSHFVTCPNAKEHRKR